jgi:hypothetical protein
MSNESIKRSAPPLESTTTDLPAELSAGLMTGHDPLDYEWTGSAEGQPSEADDAPPIEVQATDLDTWDLTEAIRLETARIAQYASSRNSTVIIGGGNTVREPVFDIDADDGPPTQRMATAPASKQDNGSMPGASSDGWNRTSTIASLLVGGASLFLFAIYFLATPGVASTPPAGGVLTAAPPVVPNSLHEAASTGGPCKASPEAPPQGEIPTRTLERAATEPSRAPSPPREVSSKSGSVDPLFVKSPGY